MEGTMVTKPRRRVCPSGHKLEESWDVCPYCTEGREGLAGTRVQDLGATGVIDRNEGDGALVAWFIALGGERRGEIFPLREGPIGIGRDPSCEVRILDEGISDHHARLAVEPGPAGPRHVLLDLDSTNGTFLNEQARRIEREEIVDNDIVRFADTELIFKTLPRRAVERLRSPVDP